MLFEFKTYALKSLKILSENTPKHAGNDKENFNLTLQDFSNNVFTNSYIRLNGV